MINAAAMEIGIGVVGAEGAIAALDSVTSAFQIAVDTAAQAELSQLSLRSLVGSEMVATGQYRDLAAATDEATVYAQHLYDWTKRLAILSPYESQDITSAVSLAQAYGFLSTQTTSVAVAQQAGVISTQRLTAATLDYLAAAGRPSHVLGNIITPLGQIKALGRATGEEMRQLSEWGVPVRRYLAEALNVSTAEIVKMQNEGLTVR
jgi:tape measure domain-containing protein